MPSFRKLEEECEGQLGAAQIRQGLVLAWVRLSISFWMRGSAIGLSFFAGVRLVDCMLAWLLVIPFTRMLGSAVDPFSFTWLSPNMLVVTELFKRPRIRGKLVDDDDDPEATLLEGFGSLVVGAIGV